jgi:hypothetical protein
MGDSEGAEQNVVEYIRTLERERLRALVEADLTIADRAYGEAVVIRYRARLEIVSGGHHVPLGHYWHTDLYERRDGRWQVTWSQATAMR